MQHKASFAKFADGTWGIRVDGYPQAVVKPGDVIEVNKRNGGTKTVTVTGVVERFNGGRTAWCTIASKQRTPKPGSNGNRPRVVPENVQLALGELGEALMKNGDDKDDYIERAMKLLQYGTLAAAPPPPPTTIALAPDVDRERLEALVADLEERAVNAAGESYLLDLADHPDADRPPGTSGSWGEA